MPLHAALRTDTETCLTLLPQVSRTFALTIALLEPPLKEQVAVGYLLCRALDTLEDSPLLSPLERSQCLAELGAACGMPPSEAAPLGRHLATRVQGEAKPAEVELLVRLPEILRVLASFDPLAQASILRGVREMAVGMAEMQTAVMRSHGALQVLPTSAALHRYCHYVAGVVGTMLTELFYLHSSHTSKEAYFSQLARSEAFAQVLQRVNILKDLAGDQAAGRCFVPEEFLVRYDLHAETWLTMGTDARRLDALAPFVLSLVEQVPAAWDYVRAVPVEERSIRLFLVYGLFFALETIRVVLSRPTSLWQRQNPPKISRADVWRLAALADRAVDDFSKLDGRFESLWRPLGQAADDAWPSGLRAALRRITALP